MKFHIFGTSKHEEGKSLLIFFLLYLLVHCGDFIEQKIICHIFFKYSNTNLRTNVPVFMLHITCGPLMLFNCTVLCRVINLETNKQPFGRT